MLKPESMLKLKIYTSKQHLKKVIKELYKAKAIDVIQHEKSEELDIGSPLEESENLSKAVLKARSLIYRLKLTQERETEAEHFDENEVQEAIDSISKISEETHELFESRKEIRKEIIALKQDLEVVKVLKNLGCGLDLYQKTKNLTYFLGYVDDLTEFKNDMENFVKNDYQVFSTTNNGKTIVSVFTSVDNDELANDVLRKHSFVDYKVDERLFDKSYTLEKVSGEVEKKRAELSKVKEKIEKVKRKYSSDLIRNEHALTILDVMSESPLMFGETTNVSIISGWIPNKSSKQIVKKLNDITDKKIYVKELDTDAHEEAPIKLDNPKNVSPYEFLLRMFSMPSYHELDPSLFMFITFPIFFGFMLGDIGYGVVLMALFGFLMKKIPAGKDLFKIMMFSAISSIFFGIVFGEVFGFEIIKWIQPVAVAAAGEVHHVASFGEWITTWPWHRNADNAMNLITMSVIFGFIHVNFGILLGFFNVYKVHGMKHAIYEKASWWVLQIGVAVIALGAMNMIPIGLTEGFIIILIAGIMLFKGEGVQGLVELPSVFVHIGSYVRLMAIGLASVGLAIVINEQSAPLFAKGPIYIVFGIVIFAIGHIINIALGVLGPFLHSLRLHYVEYFTKFYKGGGKEFKPFGVEDD